MTDTSRNTPLYPKSHLLAASGIAALLSLTLLVFPSSQVEAKKTLLPLELESEHSLVSHEDALPTAQVTPERPAAEKAPEGQPAQVVAAQPAPAAANPAHRAG